MVSGAEKRRRRRDAAAAAEEARVSKEAREADRRRKQADDEAIKVQRAQERAEKKAASFCNWRENRCPQNRVRNFLPPICV